MAISGIASPVAGTIITTAFVDLNYKDPLTYAIALLGGFSGQPGAANKMLVSSGSEAASWVDRTAAVLAALTYTPLNKAGDTSSGILVFSDDGDGVQLSQGSLITDFSGSGLTMYADSSKFRFMREGTSTEIFSGDYANAAPLWKGQVMYHSGNLPAAGAYVPSGLIAAFATAAAIASGWARYTTADGRMLVGAGTTFTVTYTENTAYGSSWAHGHTLNAHAHAGPSHTHTGPSHTHTGPSHSHGLAAAGIGGTMGGPSGTNTTGGTGNTSADGSHTHSLGSLDVTGTTDADGTGATGASGTGATGSSGTGNTGAPDNDGTNNVAWAIPSHAVVWAQKS